MGKKMTKAQRAWRKRYEDETGFEAMMCEFEIGDETFVEAAKRSLTWFEDWSIEVRLRMSNVRIPGETP